MVWTPVVRGCGVGCARLLHCIRRAIAGRVTSIAFSETLGHHIGIAFIRPELSTEGSKFLIRADGGHMVEAIVVKMPFYDPVAERQKVA